jgi:hypothetical protein
VKISCLCVTRGPWLHNAIAQFERQTHADKELIVLHQTPLTAKDRADLERLNATVFLCPQEIKLGQLRNMSMTVANGEWLAQWDDDDCYHPERLASQLMFAQASGYQATFLAEWYIHDLETGSVYTSHARLWEGSMLVQRAAVDRLQYENTMSRGEDTQFVRRLACRAKIGFQRRPELYLYQVHGGNTWPREHFEKFFLRSRKLTAANAARVLQSFYLTPQLHHCRRCGHEVTFREHPHGAHYQCGVAGCQCKKFLSVCKPHRLGA